VKAQPHPNDGLLERLFKVAHTHSCSFDKQRRAYNDVPGWEFITRKNIITSTGAIDFVVCVTVSSPIKRLFIHSKDWILPPEVEIHSEKTKFRSKNKNKRLPTH
jgi:hypothetical protein